MVTQSYWLLKFLSGEFRRYKPNTSTSMYIKFLTLIFSIIIFNSCSENSTNIKIENINNIWGVWENSEENQQSTINGKWIPNNLHISNTEEENIIRVRILDPISCTDSYTKIKYSRITFSQYGLNISILFETDNTAQFTVKDEKSNISFSFYKTDKEPFWGMCD